MSQLSAEQKAELRERLQRRRAELAADLEAELRELGLGSQADRAYEVGDAGDQAVADLLAKLEAGLAQRHTAAFERTQAALARLPTDAYGLCVDCAIAIAYARLLAGPAATRCVECQARAERGQPSPSTL